MLCSHIAYSIHTPTPTFLGPPHKTLPHTYLTHTPEQSHILRRDEVHVQYISAYNTICTLCMYSVQCTCTVSLVHVHCTCCVSNSSGFISEHSCTICNSCCKCFGMSLTSCTVCLVYTCTCTCSYMHMYMCCISVLTCSSLRFTVYNYV